MEDQQEVEKLIKYAFRDQTLLRRALIHASADAISKEEKALAKRLSWLGDSVINLVVAHRLFEILPSATKGALHEARKHLTKNKTLGGTAAEMGLEPLLLKGESLKKDPVARDRYRMLATAFESLIGAVYVDGELPMARMIVLRALEEEFRTLLSP